MTRLAPSACTLQQDNIPQTIQRIDSAASRPLTLGLLLDTSLSQQSVLPMEGKAASAFLRHLLTANFKAQTEAFLLAFDVDLTQLADLTHSPSQLQHALSSAQINATLGNYSTGTIPSLGRPKGALLYDAIVLATHKLSPEPGRKAILLFSSGIDEGSHARLSDAIRAAQASNVAVYVY